MSSMSTPAPPGTPLESRNYVDAPRPFKNPGYTRNANRRTRTLKQILAAERDAAIGSDGGVGSGKRKGRKSMLSGLNGNGASAGASTQASRAGTDELPDGDTTMASVGEVAGASVDEAMIAAAKRKRELPTYSSVEAPPSLHPRKKFCDITGLIAPYTDPKTKLRYHSVEMYEIIKTFGPGVDQAYLNLRGEASQIK